MSYKFTKQSNNKNFVFIIYFILILIIVCNYFSLQILNYKKYNIKAGNNSLRKIILKAPRGIIYDRNEIPIVDNKLIYNINIIPKDFNSNTFNYNLIDRTINVNKKTIDSIVYSNNTSVKQFRPYLIKSNIDFMKKSILEESKLDIKGLYFTNSPIRTYTSSCNLAHVLGYLRDLDQIEGYSGIEKHYEEVLKGSDGLEYHLVDRFGIDQGLFVDDNIKRPEQGKSVYLSIDSGLQSYSEEIMGENIGSIIVMDPKTGEVLTMLSTPSYELNSFAGEIPIKTWNKLIKNKDKPFNNRAIQSSYPPGSIFKLILASIVLDKKIISKDWKINCNGKYEFYDKVFHCWKEDGHGIVNLNNAIKGSCNIYFYNLIQKIDFDLWSDEVLNFGFGNILGVDLPSEKKGLVPNRKYMNETYKKKGGWSTGHLLNLSIGQGETMVTPIQTINLINIIANEGWFLTPHLNLESQDIIKKKIDYNEKTWQIIKKSMYDAVNESGGTAYKTKIDLDDVKVYGKTGTAQICSNCDLLPHAWFGGFIEVNQNKKFSIVVVIENGGKGSNKPTIMAKKIFKYILGNEDV